MGSCLKTFPEAFILNSHFHLVFLFIPNKELKTKWHFHKRATEAQARNYEHFLFHCQSRAAVWAATWEPTTALSQDPTGFPWQKWRDEWLWWGNVSPLWKCSEETETRQQVYAHACTLHMYEAEQLNRMSLKNPVTWLITIHSSVFSGVCVAVEKTADTNVSAYITILTKHIVMILFCDLLKYKLLNLRVNKNIHYQCIMKVRRDGCFKQMRSASEFLQQ